MPRKFINHVSPRVKFRVLFVDEFVSDGLEVVGHDSVDDLVTPILHEDVVNGNSHDLRILVLVEPCCHPSELFDQVLICLQYLLKGFNG